LQLAHRLEGFVRVRFSARRDHAAQQLVEHRQGGIGQAFLKPDAGSGKDRKTAPVGEFRQMLRCDPRCLVRDPVERRLRDRRGTRGRKAQRANMVEPFDQSQDIARRR
jgi:hypothetical protein